MRFFARWSTSSCRVEEPSCAPNRPNRSSQLSHLAFSPHRVRIDNQPSPIWLFHCPRASTNAEKTASEKDLQNNKERPLNEGVPCKGGSTSVHRADPSRATETLLRQRTNIAVPRKKCRAAYPVKPGRKSIKKNAARANHRAALAADTKREEGPTLIKRRPFVRGNRLPFSQSKLLHRGVSPSLELFDLGHRHLGVKLGLREVRQSRTPKLHLLGHILTVAGSLEGEPGPIHAVLELSRRNV